jgi:hypothetical protein
MEALPASGHTCATRWRDAESHGEHVQQGGHSGARGKRDVQVPPTALDHSVGELQEGDRRDRTAGATSDGLPDSLLSTTTHAKVA